ncbi:Hypothetical protein SMAX5B_021238 [Scophthalmus maximus]|uniref:Uncharacterized protein n=1 Tax=Scophthalmus maximus TaxID=52904 RepID=A0A2U9BQZ7_SCOMX|nr:Hypothetical protein SMAX5B_021238 [Scophthalmus maximus]
MFSSCLCPHPSSAQLGCFKVNNCQCIMKDGSGVINLNTMGDAGGFLGQLKPLALVHTTTMSLRTLFLSLTLCFSMFSSCLCPHPSSAQLGCFKVNNCQCIMKDGSGVINLNTMGDAGGFLGQLKPVWTENAPGEAETLLSFSPCQPFSPPEDLTGADCTDVAACLIFRTLSLSWP